MPHNLRSTALGFCQRSKQVSTAATSSFRVSKKRLCVAIRRASFQTRSMGASCGLYGGRKGSVSTLRYFRSRGASNTAWWYLALSSTTTMRLPRERCRNSFFRKAPNVRASNFSHTERTNLPLARLTAPKQATDFRVGACTNTGSLISGGTHIWHRVPCCWKWHSSTLHSATSRRLARRRSFFESRDLYGVRLGHLGSGLAQPEAHLPEDALALAHPQGNAVSAAKMLREQLAVPQMAGKTELFGITSQVSPQRRPLFGVQRCRAPRTFAFAHPLQPVRLESLDPALHRTPVFPKQIGNLLAALAAGNQQQAMQPMVVARFIGTGDFLLDGDSHYFRIGNFQLLHGSASGSGNCRQYSSIMRHYICRYV